MKKILVWDGVEGNIEEFDTFEEAKLWIFENFINEEDGIHPDIEDVFILKRTHTTDVIENEDGSYHVKFSELND